MTNPYLRERLPDELPNDPMHWAAAWLDEAASRGVQRNSNAMTLATLGYGGQPSSRVVLCKSFIADPGYLVFYTSYRSKKVADINRNPGVAVSFHWDALGRQIRIEGHAVTSPAEESDAYFASRDRGSQISAWASDQSAPVESRDALMRQLRQRAGELGVAVSGGARPSEEHARGTIPRPPHWGGIRVWATSIELWIEGSDRIHERARWQRSLAHESAYSFKVGDWKGIRLQP